MKFKTAILATAIGLSCMCANAGVFSDEYKCTLAKLPPITGIGAVATEIRSRQLVIAYGDKVNQSTMLDGIVKISELAGKAYTNQPYGQFNREAALLNSMGIKFVGARGEPLNVDRVIEQLRTFLLTKSIPEVDGIAHAVGVSPKFMEGVRALKPDFATDLSLITLAEAKELNHLKTCD
jgi:hypothetical protein